MTTEVKTDGDSYTIKYWLVHEYYSDTQRLTKMIIDAGPGKTFHQNDIDKDMFKVHFQSTHWHYGTLHYATEAGVGYGYRIIDNAYVTNTNFNELAREMARLREDLYKGQSHLPKNDSGRYLVLEFYSERELKEPGFVYDPEGNALDSASGILANYQMFQRTPGAESGWNNHSQFVQHKHDYYVTINENKTLKRYENSKIEEIKDKSNYSFALAAEKYNENELVPGHINVLFNLFEKGTWQFTPQNPGEASFFDYRLYKPADSSEKKLPLFVWLHGGDGSRVTDPVWVSGGFPDFVQNHGHLSIGSIGALASPAMQNKYGPYFVLAPQASSLGMGGGHNPAQYRKLIEKLAEQYPIDLKRIYFGGHSMGGMGSINMVLENPDFVAGVIAGPGGLPFANASGNDPATLNKLKNTPIWLVTIAGDNTLMDAGSVYLFDKLSKAEGSNVRLTYFPVQQPYDWPGNYGHKGDPALPPWGYGWSHSAYEPMMSDQITTDYKYNVNTASYTENGEVTTGYAGQITLNRDTITFGRIASGDTPGDTLFTWLFKQHR